MNVKRVCGYTILMGAQFSPTSEVAGKKPSPGGSLFQIDFISSEIFFSQLWKHKKLLELKFAKSLEHKYRARSHEVKKTLSLTCSLF